MKKTPTSPRSFPRGSGTFSRIAITEATARRPGLTKESDSDKRSSLDRVPLLRLLVVAVFAFALDGFDGSRTATADDAAPAESEISFAREIRPILSENCFFCHGPDASNRQADLRLDIEASAFADRGGYAAITPGKPNDSEIIARLTADVDSGLKMPPPESHRSVSADEVALIRRWIKAGASWESHWSFVAPEKPAVPDVADASWPRGPIDRFVLARLESEGLKPSREAARTTLLRRVTFDLTGLPPTLDEIDAFLADESADAYEKVVDRLLASPRFGERMATPWLDAARYADTFGYQADRERAVWPYRDWVVGALNDNMPYDQFLTWQIAGDLLPDATREQRLATCFNRLHMQNEEGGSVEEEFRAEYCADRVNTFGTAVLGLTLECCRCHDHKYDPISQQNYYELVAFFDNIAESGLTSHFTDAVPGPTLLLPDPQTEQKLDAANAAIAEEDERLAAYVAGDESERAFTRWLADRSRPERDIEDDAETNASVSEASAEDAVDGEASPGDESVVETSDVVEGDQSSPPGESAEESEDEVAAFPVPVAAFSFDVPSDGGTPTTENLAHADQPARYGGGPKSVSGRLGEALQMSGEDNVVMKDIGVFTRTDPFSIALWLNVPTPYDRAVVFHRARAWTDAGSRGYELLIEDGRLSFGLVHFWPYNAARIRTVEPIPPGEWTHVTVTYDGSSRATGMAIYVDGQPAAIEVVRDHLFKDVTYERVGVDLTIGQRFRDRGLKLGLVDEFLVFDTCLTSLETEALAAVGTWRANDALDSKLSALIQKAGRDALADADDTASQPQPSRQTDDLAGREALRRHYLARNDTRAAELRDAVRTARAEQRRLINGVPEIMVMEEMPVARTTHVLKRGAYDAPGEEVLPDTPASVMPLGEGRPSNRLGLAQWVTDPRHPLTGRVAVNRFWIVFFGRGLVETAEDFGSQGRPPTHPLLLDWLARDFVDSGWDVKRLCKSIAMSATYRQTAIAPSELRSRDPANDLLGRGPRHRLPAEAVRDAALAASGLLVERIGGPPVKPYQPPGLWKEKSGKVYRPSTGEGLYRRSLYTFWKRTSPPPMMLAFDAAERSVCSALRPATSTPQQSLVLMNDPQFVEAARVLATKLVEDVPGDVEERLRRAFRIICGRPPSDEESAALCAAHGEQRAIFATDPSAADRILSVGQSPQSKDVDELDAAATAVVVSMLMSFDGFVMK